MKKNGKMELLISQLNTTLPAFTKTLKMHGLFIGQNWYRFTS